MDSPEDCGYLDWREFDDGAVAAVAAMLFGKYRVVLCRSDWRYGYDDGW